MTEVIPRLHIGNWHDARENLNTMHVVTVACDSPVTGRVKFDLIDGPGNNRELIVQAANYVMDAHDYGDNVLVHCHGGRSRSGVVTVLAMTKITGKNVCECYDLLVNTHKSTRIHPFLSKLLLEILL